MAVSISACPNCRTMVFSDTVQCPACKHVLDTARQPTDAAPDSSAPAPSAPASPGLDEIECPNCHEMVRDGLVRCWNCSAFMRDDIAESYRQMQSEPQPVIYSELPTESIGSGDYRESGQTFQAEDRDFELSPQVVTSQAVTSQVATNRIAEPVAQPTPTLPAVAQQSSEDDDTYTLSQPAPAPTPAPLTAAAKNGDAEQPAPEKPANEDSAVDHSVATGGDALLAVALAEEAEGKKRRRARKEGRKVGPRSKTGLLVFCPNGHRIEVQEKHRGMTGRCPKCKSRFFVPVVQTKSDPSAEGASAEVETGPTEAAGKYERWLTDVRIHAFKPENLKLKANSLKNEFRLYDLGFAKEEVAAAALTKKKGAVGASSKKRLADREAMLTALRDSKSLDASGAVESIVFTAEHVREIRVVQPAPYAHESMFAGITVFGEGRIAVRLPADDAAGGQQFLSFALSEFRKLSEILAENFEIKNFGVDCGVPLTETYSEYKCHYSEEPVKSLEDVDYYQADETFEVELSGRKCQGCGIVVSEDSRKKEKIGGANGKAIAKAKCPKCKAKFGDTTFFALKATALPQDDSEESAETQSSTDEANSSESKTAQTAAATASDS